MTSKEEAVDNSVEQSTEELLEEVKSNNSISKSKKKALKDLKKEMKRRIKEIEETNSETSEPIETKRKRKGRNILTLIISLVLTGMIFFLPAYYDNRLISSRIDLPFVLDYSDGLNDLEIQILIITVILLFIFIKITQKKIRDRIKAVFNFMKNFLICILLTISISYLLSIINGKNLPNEFLVNWETPFIWTPNNGFNETGVQVFVIILLIIFSLIQIIKENNQEKIKQLISYLKPKFWSSVNWTLETIYIIYNKILPFLNRIRKKISSWADNFPGKSQESIHWMRGKYSKFSNWIVLSSQGLRKYAREQMIKLGSTINNPLNTLSDIEIKFRKSELIGVGGMANVFNSREVKTGNRTVWKEAASSRINPLPEVNRRLSDESEILKSLNHERIPNHIDFGEIKNNNGEKVVVMIMEHIQGKSLKDDLETLDKMNKRFNLEEATKIISEICEPLEYMADLETSIYHRDLKPSNIIFEPNRGPVLIDFGLAKGVDAGNDISLSQGMSEGWSPPERRDGISGGFTDVFSLGQTLWNMLTGERPFHALTDSEITEKIVQNGHPEWVSKVIFESAQRYDKRIQSIYEFRVLLEDGSDK